MTRPIERDYLQVIGDLVTLDTWRAICNQAVELAKEGDKGARDWLSGIVLGKAGMTLSGLARRERVGVTADDELQAHVEYDHMDSLQRLRNADADSPLELAEAHKLQEAQERIEAERREQERLERERRRAEREARKAAQLATGDQAGQNGAAPA